jgi:peptidoglycan hydrolase CwlO-like protein
LQAKAISDREAMIAIAQLQADKEHGLLELTNKQVAEVSTFLLKNELWLRIRQLQEQIKERNIQITKLQQDLQTLAEEKIQLARDAKEEAKRIREANATGENAELVAERDAYKASSRLHS